MGHYVQLTRTILLKAELYLYSSKMPVSVWLGSCATNSSSLSSKRTHTPWNEHNTTVLNNLYIHIY